MSSGVNDRPSCHLDAQSNDKTCVILTAAVPTFEEKDPPTGLCRKWSAIWRCRSIVHRVIE